VTWMEADGEAEARFRSLSELAPEPRSMPTFMQALYDESWRVRRLAADRLVQVGGQALVEELVMVLGQRGQTGARNAAASALAQLGATAAGPLVTLLGHADPDQRKFAADILAELRERSTVPALVKALDDGDPNVRTAAAEALGRVGGPQALRALEELLGSGDALLRVCALEGLSQLKCPPPLPRLKPLLGDPLTRRSAFRLLGHVQHPAALALICQGLKTRESRDAALVALGTRGVLLPPDVVADVRAVLTQVREAHQWLAAALGSDDRDRRCGALLCAHALGAATLASEVADTAAGGELAELSLQVLLELGVEGVRWLLGGEPPRVAMLSRDARAVVGEATLRLAEPSLVPALEALLRMGDLELSELATRALGRTRARTAIPVVVGLFADDTLAVHAFRAAVSLGESWPDDVRAQLAPLMDQPLQPHALRAWAQLAGVDSLPVLRRALHDERDPVRAAAAESSVLVPAAAVELLGAALVDEAPRVRRAAASVLHRLEPAVAAPLLSRALADADTSVQAVACEVAAQLGAVADVARLTWFTASADPSVVLAALRALALLGALTDDGLRSAGQHADAEVLKAALALGADRASMVDRGVEALSHPRWDVRVAAARALAVSGGRTEAAVVKAALDREADPLAHEVLEAAAAALKVR